MVSISGASQRDGRNWDRPDLAWDLADAAAPQRPVDVVRDRD